MKDVSRERQIAIGIASGYALLKLSEFAFTHKSRREIGERDAWCCTGDHHGNPCTLGHDGNPASFQDGYWVQAAHLDHSRKNPNYDNPDNGVIRCAPHHALEHFERGEMWEAQAILNQGIYSWDHVNKTGEQILLKVEDLPVFLGLGVAVK